MDRCEQLWSSAVIPRRTELKEEEKKSRHTSPKCSCSRRLAPHTPRPSPPSASLPPASGNFPFLSRGAKMFTTRKQRGLEENSVHVCECVSVCVSFTLLLPPLHCDLYIFHHWLHTFHRILTVKLQEASCRLICMSKIKKISLLYFFFLKITKVFPHACIPLLPHPSSQVAMQKKIPKLPSVSAQNQFFI